MKLTVVLTVLSLALLGDIGTKTAEAKTLTVSQKKVLTKNYQQSVNTLEWFQTKKHNWRLHKRFTTCYGVKVEYSAKRAGICYISRTAYRRHKERLNKLKPILFPAPALPPHYSQWLCIKSHEASWDNPGIDWRGNFSGYYGGLQMDMDFQRTYGGHLLRTKGTANNWTPLEQMWVAERAYSSGRGFYPWPNTARYCGLI